MSLPQHKTPEQHAAMFEYLKAKLKKDLVEKRYSISFKKPELEGLISACTLAEMITRTRGIVQIEEKMVIKSGFSQSVKARTNETSVNES